MRPKCRFEMIFSFFEIRYIPETFRARKLLQWPYANCKTSFGFSLSNGFFARKDEISGKFTSQNLHATWKVTKNEYSNDEIEIASSLLTQFTLPQKQTLCQKEQYTDDGVRWIQRQCPNNCYVWSNVTVFGWK